MSQKEPRPLYQRRIAHAFVLLVGLFVIYLVVFNYVGIGMVDLAEFSGDWGIRNAAFNEDPINNFPLFLQNFAEIIFFGPAIIHPLAPYVIWLIMGLFLIILNSIKLLKTFSKKGS